MKCVKRRESFQRSGRLQASVPAADGTSTMRSPGTSGRVQICSTSASAHAADQGIDLLALDEQAH
jgi:hypothetical protein